MVKQTYLTLILLAFTLVPVPQTATFDSGPVRSEILKSQKKTSMTNLKAFTLGTCLTIAAGQTESQLLETTTLQFTCGKSVWVAFHLTLSRPEFGVAHP
jgi:hypothetical protein